MTEENNTETNTEENITIETPAVETTSSAFVEPTMTIGKLIKQKREERGLSLKVISQQTKIHIGLLENLEADQFEKLPSKTYVRGFIKSTSKILGLDQEFALHLLDMAYAKSNPMPNHPVPNQEMKTETARNTLTSMAATPMEAVKSVTSSSMVFLAKAAVGVLIVGIVGFNIKNFLQKSSDENDVKLPEVLTTLHKKKAPAPKPVAKPVLPVKPAEPITVNLIQDKNQKSDVTVNDINMQAISLGDKQFVEDTAISSEKMNELFPAKYRVQSPKGTETLFINASEGDSWLTYKVDDKEIKKYVLRQGRTLFIRGGVIRLFIGNTKSLKAFYNNKAINLAAGNKGVKNIVLPEEMKTKFMAPLFVFQEDGSVITSEDYIKTHQGKAPPAPTPATEGSKVEVKSKIR
ncbi:MAG: helix-turn-helix domain-containing protein [Rhizobacter sp.]|nr:helix-turn-helix domain-containing protein [Bacteriovorax sp.]